MEEDTSLYVAFNFQKNVETTLVVTKGESNKLYIETENGEDRVETEGCGCSAKLVVQSLSTFKILKDLIPCGIHSMDVTYNNGIAVYWTGVKSGGIVVERTRGRVVIPESYELLLQNEVCTAPLYERNIRAAFYQMEHAPKNTSYTFKYEG